MRIITAEQMQRIDAEAIHERGIPGLLLMERAGKGCADAVIRELASGNAGNAVVIAGKGNNGGDGYVVARLLFAEGWKVSVIVLASREQIAGDAAVNLDRLSGELPVEFCSDEARLDQLFRDIPEESLLIDAIFGTGLKSEVSGLQRRAIELVNLSGHTVVAVDIPSGVHGSSGEVLGAAIRANLTVTFASAKLGHVLYPGASYVGRLEIADIGIPGDILNSVAGYEYLDYDAASSIIKPRDPVAHKGRCGHCLIIAGSTGHTGAAALSGASAVRGGAGLVTLAVPASLNAILEVKTTEAMTLPLNDRGLGHLGADLFPEIIATLPGKDVLAIGPGISWQRETAALVRKLVRDVPLPMVIDADALNAISEECSVLLDKKTAMILTPHPGEMARLTGKTVREIESDRIAVAGDFARHYGVYLVLKGARTVIASPDGAIAINGSGNPGMASGGMGDVLTGLIAALLGQGYSPFDASCLGVFLHGYAADLVAAEKGEVGISATDVIESLPYAHKKLIEARSMIG